jgi:hypothetical protein
LCAFIRKIRREKENCLLNDDVKNMSEKRRWRVGKKIYTKENEKFIKEVQSLFPFHVALYSQMCTKLKRK